MSSISCYLSDPLDPSRVAISNLKPAPRLRCAPAQAAGSAHGTTVPRASGCGASHVWLVGWALPQRLALLVDLEVRPLQVLCDPPRQLPAAFVPGHARPEFRRIHLLAAEAIVRGQATPPA
jgi:hypothetical protein